jgi:hypothetical protein
MGTGMTEDLAISTLAGDYGTPAAAYSVRKVRTAYSGALMDVRRSFDNVTQSIGFVDSGDLDTGSLLDWTIPGRNDLPGEYEGLAAAYSLRKVSASYDGYAVKVRGDIENQTRDIGFDASGNLDTGSLLNFTATGSNTLAGSYSGLAAAYSLRKVVPGYAGDAIEVQSGSVSQSIGFDSIGNLDTGSLLTFVGSGDAYVKTWYDQSGNNNHATQSVAASQPQIVSSGVIMTESGKPTLKFDGNDELSMSGLFGQSTLDTYFVTSTSDTQYLYPNFGISSYGFVAQNSTSTNITSGYGSPSLYANGTLFTGTTRENVYNFLNGTKLIIHQGANTSTWTAYTFGKYSSFTYSGSLQELIAYTSSQASNRPYIENNINAYYDIYTTSSTSTENAFVSTWYDQSGNNRHATQTTSSRQPLIVSSGSLVTENGKPALSFDGSTNYLETSTFGPISQPYTTFTHVEYASMPDYPYLVDHGDEIGLIGAYNAGGGHRIYAGGNLYFGSSAVINTPYLYYGLFSGSNSAISINGATAVTGSAGSAGISKITLGSSGRQSPGTFFSGSFFEHLEYYSDQSANKALIENNINNYYNIYTGSNHGFVARWYDQSGNNRHATQTATGSQPMIVLSGSVITQNSRYALNFNGTSHTLSSSFGTTIAQPVSIFSVYKPDITGSIHPIYDGTGARITHWVGGNKYNTFAGVDLLGVQTTTLNQVLHTGIYNGASSLSNINSVLDRAGNAGANGTSGIRIGGWFDLSYFFTGKIQELVIYPTNQSSITSIEYGINSYYNIYAQPTDPTFVSTSSFTIQATPTAISGAINNKLTSGIPSSGPLGLITVSRTGSNSLTIARNGAVSSFTTPASGALSTGIYLGAINNNGLALGNSPLNLSFASVGTGLTGGDALNLNRLVYSLQYNLGRPDPDYIAILNYATIQGYTLPTPAVQLHQNRLINDLKAAGIWSKLDTFAVFATNGNSNFALIDWKRLTQYTAVNSPSFTTNQGFKGNGSNMYINMNYNPVTNGINFLQDNASMGVYISQNIGKSRRNGSIYN